MTPMRTATFQQGRKFPFILRTCASFSFLKSWKLSLYEKGAKVMAVLNVGLRVYVDLADSCYDSVWANPIQADQGYESRGLVMRLRQVGMVT
jgi:hypothetical protein